MLRRTAVALLGASGLAPLAQAAAPPAYSVTKTVPLGAPDRWDYLTFDRASHRLYVSHSDRVEVLDGHDGRKIGQVIGMPGGSHGIAIANGQGYTDDGQAGVVVVFDLKTFKVLKRIPARPDADGVVFDAPSGHVFVTDGDSKTLTVIDPATDTAIKTIDAGGKLEFAVSGGDGKLYVNGAGNKELIRVDTRTNAVDAHWPTPGCASPRGIAFDPAVRRAFVTCGNKVMTVVNVDTGAVIATLPIGAGTDAAAFDPKRKLAFSSNGTDGTLSLVRETGPDTFVSAGAVRTAATGRTMAIDPDTGRLYVAAAQIDSKAPVEPGPNGRPGSLAVLFLDPTG